MNHSEACSKRADHTYFTLSQINEENPPIKHEHKFLLFLSHLSLPHTISISFIPFHRQKVVL